MNELKEKALAKMLEEMTREHSPAEDAIHNWLCDQEDEKLFKGVLDDKKSIKGAMRARVRFFIKPPQYISKVKKNQQALLDEIIPVHDVGKFYSLNPRIEVEMEVMEWMN